MKKAISIAIFVLLLLLPTAPVVVKAQTFSVEQENQMKAIIQQITDLQIQLLLARITELQAQIATLIAQQATTEAKVDTVIINTTPVLGSVPTPPTPPPAPTISVGEVECYNVNTGYMASSLPPYMSAKVPVNISGSYTNGFASTDGNLVNPNPSVNGSIMTDHREVNFTPTDLWTQTLLEGRYEGTYTYTIKLSNQSNVIAEKSGTFVAPNCEL